MPKPVTQELLIEAMYRYKIDFSKAASMAGGTIRWAGQHSFLWGAMNKGGKGQFNEDYWVGVCAGLAIEWMKAKRKKEDLVGKFLDARKEALTQKGAKPEVAKFSAMINKAHAAQGVKAAGFLQSDFRKAGEDDFSYPYNNFGSSLVKKLYYYISSGTHVMAAYVNPKGKVDFYDPNVAEIIGTSPTFFDSYFKDLMASSAIAAEKDLETLKATKKITAYGYQSL